MVVWKVAGFTMIILMTGLQSIPGELQEAATIDGAGPRRFRHITLPLMRRTMALALILSVTGSVLAFDQFYIILRGGPRNQTLTAVYWIFNQSFVSFKLGYGSALSMVLLVILVLLSLDPAAPIAQRESKMMATGTAASDGAVGRFVSPNTPSASRAALFLAPIGWTVLSSFKPPREASQPPLPPWPTTGLSHRQLRRARRIWRRALAAGAEQHLVAALTVVLTVIVSLLAGYGFSRFRFPFKDVLFVVILSTIMIPFQSILTPIFLILTKLGLTTRSPGWSSSM